MLMVRSFAAVLCYHTVCRAVWCCVGVLLDGSGRVLRLDPATDRAFAAAVGDGVDIGRDRLVLQVLVAGYRPLRLAAGK